MFPNLNRRVTIGVVCAAMLVGGWTWWQCARFKHLAVHDPGRVYRSAWLNPQPLREVIERYQIRTVVNLCEPGEMGEQRIVEERAAVKSAGARLVELTMPTDLASDNPLISKHMAVLGDPNNYPLLVHCQHGVTRTSKLLAMYDIAYRDQSGDQSLAMQPKFGREDHNVHVKAFIREFELKHRRLYPEATASKLDVLRH